MHVAVPGPCRLSALGLSRGGPPPPAPSADLCCLPAFLPACLPSCSEEQATVQGETNSANVLMTSSINGAYGLGTVGARQQHCLQASSSTHAAPQHSGAMYAAADFTASWPTLGTLGVVHLLASSSFQTAAHIAASLCSQHLTSPTASTHCTCTAPPLTWPQPLPPPLSWPQPLPPPPCLPAAHHRRCVGD
jgi:hypothetical protein